MKDHDNDRKKAPGDKRIYTLSREKPARAVIKMGVPLILGMFIMVLYNLVDTYFIGLMKDDYRLAAVNLAYPVLMITVAVSNIIGTGAGTLIARSLGAKDEEKASRTLTAGIVLTVFNGAVITAAGLVFLPMIVSGLGAGENTYEYTRQYVGVLIAGSVFTMGSYTFGQLLRSEGSVRYSIMGMMAGTVLNIALDPLFIFTFNMGLRGAAIATVLGNAAGTGISLLFYVRRKTLLRPSIKWIKPEGKIIAEIFWVGVPASLETLLTSAAFIVNNRLAVSYGELTVAAMGIAQKLLTLGNYIYQGFASGTQPIMGYCYGAKRFDRMLKVLRSGIAVVSLTELGVMAVYAVFAPALVGLFTDSEQTVSTGALVLRTLMLILPFVGATSMSRMSFQAMGKPQYAFSITLVRQLILYIPFLLIFNSLFSFGGLLTAQPITEVIMMIVSVSLLYRTIKRNKKI